MIRTIEVELRYRLLDPNQKIELDLKPGKRIVDTYIDTPEGAYYKRGIFIRNRNGKKLDFKFNMEDLDNKDAKHDHTHCDEYSFSIPFNPEDMKNFKEVCDVLGVAIPKEFSYENFTEANGFQTLAIVDKSRMHTSKDGFDVSVDDVKRLGKFIEVEKIVEVDADEVDYKKRLSVAKQEVADYIQSLDLNAVQFNSGFVELVLRETNLELYLQGKFVLAEDK